MCRPRAHQPHQVAAITLLALLLSPTPAHPQGTRFLRQPDVSATHIVFTHANDLWKIARDGGDAIRLTSSEGAETDAAFSPDGRWIAFTGQYDGNTDVYLMPATGGQPERLTWHPSQDAPTAVPTSAYEAASAFANTGGGTIVFGVRDRDRDGEVEVVGVDRVDKVQNEFLSTIRSGQKLSRSIEVDADAIEVDGKTLLAFFIPESPRSRKPVYLDGNPNRTFIRRGGCNERCRRSELEHFLRDAAEDRYDSRVLERVGSPRVLRP